jgi:hypothetical protein
VWCSTEVSPWSIFLFVFFINDVSRVVKYSRFHIYPDDLQIYHSFSVLDLQRCYDEMNMDLQQIHEWATANGLKLNSEKSQVILIHRYIDAELIFHLLPCL